MSTPKTDEQSKAALWCIHIAGPDEIHACTSERDAVERAKVFNEWANNLAKERGYDFIQNPATPQPWPDYFKAEDHAIDLRRQLNNSY
jgi:hypothetical protein